MSDYKVARLDDIDEITDGREPWRPVRHHFGIRSFGVNAWTGHAAGDRILNEHDEADEDEELYVVQSGRAPGIARMRSRLRTRRGARPGPGCDR